MEVLQVFVFAVVGVAIAYLQSRFGAFENLKPGQKQISNGVLALVLPGLVAWSAGWWSPSFGDANEVLTQVAYLIVPVVVWVITQVSHQIDRLLQKYGNK